MQEEGAKEEEKGWGWLDTLGLKNNEDAIIESGMSIFKLITLRGESIYYRDKSQIDRMLNI
ncbi:hypothetical protein FACS189426_22770 [Bacteroidia bacterium]|nr:hypothetical protein FACS189426_22770 [Bacteroidia bacterium]